jgi:hypothetical protein
MTMFEILDKGNGAYELTTFPTSKVLISLREKVQKDNERVDNKPLVISVNLGYLGATEDHRQLVMKMLDFSKIQLIAVIVPVTVKNPFASSKPMTMQQVGDGMMRVGCGLTLLPFALIMLWILLR